jgi:hypothetical protein
LWREQGCFDEVAGEVTERERGLEAGDACAGDQDVEGGVRCSWG